MRHPREKLSFELFPPVEYVQTSVQIIGVSGSAPLSRSSLTLRPSFHDAPSKRSYVSDLIILLSPLSIYSQGMYHTAWEIPVWAFPTPTLPPTILDVINLNCYPSNPTADAG